MSENSRLPEGTAEKITAQFNELWERFFRCPSGQRSRYFNETVNKTRLGLRVEYSRGISDESVKKDLFAEIDEIFNSTFYEKASSKIAEFISKDITARDNKDTESLTEFSKFSQVKRILQARENHYKNKSEGRYQWDISKSIDEVLKYLANNVEGKKDELEKGLYRIALRKFIDMRQQTTEKTINPATDKDTEQKRFYHVENFKNDLSYFLDNGESAANDAADSVVLLKKSLKKTDRVSDDQKLLNFSKSTIYKAVDNVVSKKIETIFNSFADGKSDIDETRAKLDNTLSRFKKYNFPLYVNGASTFWSMALPKLDSIFAERLKPMEETLSKHLEILFDKGGDTLFKGSAALIKKMYPDISILKAFSDRDDIERESIARIVSNICVKSFSDFITKKFQEIETSSKDSEKTSDAMEKALIQTIDRINSYTKSLYKELNLEGDDLAVKSILTHAFSKISEEYHNITYATHSLLGRFQEDSENINRIRRNAESSYDNKYTAFYRAINSLTEVNKIDLPADKDENTVIDLAYKNTGEDVIRLYAGKRMNPLDTIVEDNNNRSVHNTDYNILIKSMPESITKQFCSELKPLIQTASTAGKSKDVLHLVRTIRHLHYQLNESDKVFHTSFHFNEAAISYSSLGKGEIGKQ